MKLTIAFPTYNRGRYLIRAITSVIQELPQLPASIEVELIIYDNASSDETPVICRELQKIYLMLKVVRHAVNIGADRNILHALLSSDGDYVWIFGDDDYLRTGALKKICDFLGPKNIDLLKINFIEERDIGYHLGAVSVRKFSPINSQVFLEHFADSGDILDRFGMGMGNFTSSIFSCSFFKRSYQPASMDFFSSGYSQLGWIYAGIKNFPKNFGFIDEPLLVIRVELTPRDVLANLVEKGLNLLEEKLIEIGYPKRVVSNLITRQHDAILLGRVKSRKIHGLPTSIEVRNAMVGLSNYRQRLKLFVIVLMPTTIYRKIWLKI